MVNINGMNGSADSRIFHKLVSYRRNGRNVNFGKFFGLENQIDMSERVYLTIGTEIVVLK